MNKVLLALMMALGVTLVSNPAMARRGADDPAGHVRQCRGCDDPAGHVRQARGADDPVGHEMNEHANGHEANEHANGHEANDDRGRGRGRGGDDGPNHQ
jgi:hypothetical protein